MKTYCTSYPYQPPQTVFTLFADQPDALFLDREYADTPVSIIAFDPIETFDFKATQPTEVPFKHLQTLLTRYAPETHAEHPYFTGGLAGLFSYDLGRATEKMPSQARDSFSLPDISVGVYLKVLVFHHKTQILSFFVTAPSESQAQNHFQALEIRLQQKKRSPAKSPSLIWTPDQTKEGYKASIQKVIDYIHAGDIFQACLAQRFTAPLPDDFDPYAHYCHLRILSPAPYACYMKTGDIIISSNSPEQFLTLTHKGEVETSPIKGTAPRHTDPTHLQKSEKNRAENIMIVDLLRNDLSRTCQADSINVPELCTLKSYANVHHLVSKVTGTLKSEHTALDLLRTCFPGGSISGAPKIRAMEIIDEIEPVRRHAYCGSLGTLGFDGTLDMNILIRTLIFKDTSVYLSSGGGIVADSDPEEEYQETLDKAQKLFESFEGKPS